MQVTPTFYKLDGTKITGETVLIKAAEIRYVDFKKLLPPGHRNERDWGGLSLFYYGVAREMWAQYRFLGVNGGGNADEFFIVRSEQRAEVQEAAWWMPNGSTAILALGNITDAATGATVSFGNGDTQTIDLAPHETQVIRHEHSAKKGAESVKIEFAGAPGSIIPTGVITSQDGTFNSVIRFYDTNGTKQPHLFANGFRLGGVTPHMILKNTSASAVTARPKFITQGGVAADPVSLPEVSLAAGETREIDLAPLSRAAETRPDLDVVSVQVNNSGAPGTLIGSLYGISNSTGVNYDTPLRDSGPVRTMTGSYPWKVSKDFTTVVYITNITDEQAEFVGVINYSGNHFLIDARKLAPGETARIDLREVQTRQEVNNEGQRMSKGFSQGQFKWAARGDTKGKIVLIGRAEMVSPSQRVSTSYSCNDPCPPSYEGSIDPFLPPVVFVNLSGGSAAWETVCYSWGTCYGPYSVYASWSLDNQVGSLSPSNGSSTTLTGSASGYATLDGFIGIQSAYSYDGRDCYYNYSYNEGGQMPVEVAAVGKIQYQSGSNFVDISGTLYVLKGTSVTFKAVPDPTDATFESGKPVWSGSSGVTGTGETKSVTFNTKSSSTSDFKTVVATAGNSMTVNVIVYELTNVLTPQDNFTGRSTTSYGVAEVINLSFTASPSITATQAGGLQWKQTTGNGNVTGMTDGTGTYTADDAPDSATLKLEVQAGPSKTLGPSSMISVIAPSGAYQVKDPSSNIKHLNGTCSAGFRAITYLLPKNVSFMNIEAREGTTNATATGWLAGSNGEPHQVGSWLPVANCTLSLGCQIQAFDGIYSQYPPNFGGTMWGNGVFDWNIPREWRVGAGSATQYTTLLHHFVSDSTGKGTISKGGAGPFSKNAADPTSNF